VPDRYLRQPPADSGEFVTYAVTQLDIVSLFRHYLCMTERKTDVLNLRLDQALASEIERIAEWRQTSVSEVARDLLAFGVAVERQLEAEELRRPYTSGSARASENVEIRIDAKLHILSYRELAEREADEAEERAAFSERHPEWDG
jgi:hypothetical protein